MKSAAHMFFIVLALVCFLLATLGVVTRPNLIALGLASLTVSFIL